MMEWQNRRSGVILPISGKILPIGEFQVSSNRTARKRILTYNGTTLVR